MAINAGDILGALLQGDRRHVAEQRLGNAAQGGFGGLLQQVLGGAGGSAAGGGGLGGLLQSALGGRSGGMGTGAGGGLAEMAQSILGGSGTSGAAGGGLAGQARDWAQQNPKLAAGGLGALAGMLFGGGPRGAIGGAALGMLGLVAMNALKAMNQPAQAGTAAGATPQLTTEEAAAALPSDPDEAQRRAMLLISAMIAAAKADGRIDDTEMQKIAGKLEEAGVDEEGKQWVLAEMAKPLDLDALVAGVRDSQTGAQVYAASLLAITVDTPAEQDYLRQLAQKLNLPQPAVASIHQALGVQANSAI